MSRTSRGSVRVQVYFAYKVMQYRSKSFRRFFVKSIQPFLVSPEKVEEKLLTLGYGTQRGNAPCTVRCEARTSRMVLLLDCDPSTLTRAPSAGYNTMYVPIERVRVA